MSATLNLSTPWTLRSGLTTAMGSEEGPILQVPAWWFSGRLLYWIWQSQYAWLFFLYWLHIRAVSSTLFKPYVSNACALDNFKIFWIPWQTILLSICSAKSLPQIIGASKGLFDASVIRPENYLHLIAISRTFIS